MSRMEKLSLLSQLSLKYNPFRWFLMEDNRDNKDNIHTKLFLMEYNRNNRDNIHTKLFFHH